MGCGDIGNFLGNVTDGMGVTNYSGDRALDAQSRASEAANNTMRGIYDQQRADMEPWRQAGIGALGTIQDNKFMDNWQQDPGYQFRMQEGNKAINAAASARGNAGGGATMKALTRYGQDYSSGEYDKVYNRNYNRLSSLAGFGNNAAQSNVNSAGVYGQGVASNQIGMGNAAASNQVAQSNRFGQMLDNGVKAGAQAYAACDENLKTEIRPVPKEDLEEMKSYLKAYAFKYINEKKHGEGEWIGVMAQDLEKSKLGKTLVVENDMGEKYIDMNKLLLVFLATMAEG